MLDTAYSSVHRSTLEMSLLLDISVQGAAETLGRLSPICIRLWVLSRASSQIHVPMLLL